jgi:hypothetical protein
VAQLVRIVHWEEGEEEMRLQPVVVTAIFGLATSSVGAAVVTPGNLVVLQSDEGTNAAQTAVPISLLEFSRIPNSPVVQTLAVPSSGAARLTIGAGTGTEGLVTYNDGYIGVAGYDADPGTASVFAGTTNATRRMIGYDVSQDLNAGPQFNATTTYISNGNFRSALYSSAAGGMYGVGNSSSINFQPNGGSGAGTNVAAASGGLYGISIFGGNTYVYQGSGSHGIYEITGTPNTATGESASMVVATPAADNQGKAVTGFNFWISPDLTTAYLAEDTDPTSGTPSVNTGGIKKFTNTGGTWSLDYTINTDYDGAGSAVTGVKSIAVDDSGAVPVLYATSSDRAALLSITDTGTETGAEASISVLQTAAAGEVFRSVAFVPVPEPTSTALLALGGLFAVSRRSRKSVNVR